MDDMNDLSQAQISAGIETLKVIVKDFTITPEQYVAAIYLAMERAKGGE